MLELKNILEDFYRISGLDISIIDAQFNTIFTLNGICGSNFCTQLHRFPQCLNACIASDKKTFSKVSQSRNSYMYTCPFGITEFFIPIISENTTIGYLFLAIGILNTENERLLTKNITKMASELSKEKIQEILQNTPHYSTELCLSYFHMAHVLADYIAKHHLLPKISNSLAASIKEYIDLNFENKITLANLSQKMHCCTVTLTECFRKEYHTSIMQYVMQKRMEHALALLDETELSITDISIRCGFKDVEYFSRTFKNLHGMPPTLWRKRE